MKIKRIEPIAVAFPMKKPVYMAGVEIKQADNILIRIEADNGAVGWGEAAEAPTMTGETVEGMFAAASYILPALIGRDAEDIEGASAAMTGRSPALPRYSPTMAASRGSSSTMRMTLMTASA